MKTLPVYARCGIGEQKHLWGEVVITKDRIKSTVGVGNLRVGCLNCVVSSWFTWGSSRLCSTNYVFCPPTGWRTDEFDVFPQNQVFFCSEDLERCSSCICIRNCAQIIRIILAARYSFVAGAHQMGYVSVAFLIFMISVLVETVLCSRCLFLIRLRQCTCMANSSICLLPHLIVTIMLQKLMKRGSMKKRDFLLVSQFLKPTVLVEQALHSTGRTWTILPTCQWCLTRYSVIGIRCYVFSFKMNASLVELMGRSLNTSKDIADFKVFFYENKTKEL